MAQNVGTHNSLEMEPLLGNAAPNGRGVAPASNPKFLDGIFQNIVLSGSDPLASGIAINTLFKNGDFTWSHRTVCDLIGSIKPDNFTAGPGGTAVYQAGGFATTVYALSAPVQMMDEYQNIVQAEKIRDSEGANFARVALVQDATLAAGGTAFAGYRTTAITSAVKGVAPTGFTAPTMLGRVTYCFVFVGIIFFTLYYLILSTVLGVKIYQGEKFKNEMAKSAENLKEPAAAIAKFEFLRKQLTQVPENLYEDEISDNRLQVDLDERNIQLAEEALSYGVAELEKLLESVDEKRTKVAIRTFLIEKIGDIGLVEWGRAIRLKKLEMKRDAQLARLTSKGCVELIKNAVTPAEKITAVEKVEKALQANRSIYAQVIAACMMGAIFMMAGLFVTTGVGAIVIAVAMVIVAFVMIYLDQKCLNDSLASEAPRKLDKTLLRISTLLCVASFATVLGLIMAGLIIASPYVVITSCLLTLLWLVFNMKALNAIEEKEKKFNTENPTLETLLQGLSAGMSAVEFKQIIEKLPKETQVILREELNIDIPNRQDAIDAVLNAMGRMTLSQQAKVKELRLELAAIK